MGLSFSDRNLTDGVIEVLHNVYYYTANWKLSVASFTGQNTKYWQELPSKLRAGQRRPKELEDLIRELETLAAGAPE